MKRLACCVVAAAMMLAAGSAPPAKPANAARAQARPDDRALEEAIRARFAKSKIAVNNFSVHVQAGTATIEGRTDVVQHKGVATRLAKLAGAKQVVNRIAISEAARQKAASNLAKGRRRAQITRGDQRSEPRTR